jgi:hypothetical protein
MSISESEISIGGLASSLFVSELSDVGQELFWTGSHHLGSSVEGRRNSHFEVSN